MDSFGFPKECTCGGMIHLTLENHLSTPNWWEECNKCGKKSDNG